MAKKLRAESQKHNFERMMQIRLQKQEGEKRKEEFMIKRR